MFKDVKALVRGSQFRKDTLLLVVVIPLMLLSLFLLPSYAKNQLILEKEHPTLLALYTTNFVHEHTGHFVENLGFYLLVVIPVYILNFRAGEMRNFYRMMLLCFILLPFLLSLFDLLIPTRRTLGFSGIDAAWLGFLPYSVLIYFKKSHGWKPDLRSSLNLAIMFSLGIILIRLQFYGATLLKLTLFCLVEGLFLVGFVTQVRAYSPKVYFSPLKRMFRSYRLAGVYLLASLVAVYLVGLAGLFPEEIVRIAEGRLTITGIHSHYVGFIFGFLVSYTFARRRERCGRFGRCLRM